MKSAFLFSLLLSAMPNLLLAEDGQGEGTPAFETVDSLQFSSCFERDPKMGLMPKSGCTANVKATWGDRPHVYRFNKMGLLDRDFSAKPDAKTFRILILGPLFDSFNLAQEETTQRRLEERMRAAQVEHIEVINGQVAGFYAPRSAEYAVRLIHEYSPDLVIYFEPADAINHDMLESKALRYHGNEVESFEAAAQEIAAPPLLGWLWPEPATQRMISASYRQMLELWSLHRSSRNSDEEARALVAPTISALKKIEGALGPDQRMLVFYSAQTIQNGFGGRGDFRSPGVFFNKLSPPLFMPPDLVTLYLRTAGFHVYPLARGFRTPLQNELVYARHPCSLTPQGAHAFAWSATYWTLPEMKTMKKGKDMKNVKTVVAPAPRRRRARGG